MRFETILLSLERDEARELISDRVSDIRSNTTNGEIEYRTNAGILLAVLSETVLPSDETGSKLRYRTVMISPQLAHARTQAQAIKRAVESFKVT